MIASEKTFAERLLVVQEIFTGQPVMISGGNRLLVKTTCIQVVHTENENIDFICENQTRYGMRLSNMASITRTSVSDTVSAWNQFTRKVELAEKSNDLF